MRGLRLDSSSAGCFQDRDDRHFIICPRLCFQLLQLLWCVCIHMRQSSRLELMQRRAMFLALQLESTWHKISTPILVMDVGFPLCNTFCLLSKQNSALKTKSYVSKVFLVAAYKYSGLKNSESSVLFWNRFDLGSMSEPYFEIENPQRPR